MNKVTNLDEFYKSDVNSILDYITSDDIFDYESQIIEKLSDFELKFNKLFLKSKENYYVNKPLNMNSKFKLEIAEWMLERLISLDLRDSIDKFFFLN